MARRCLGVRFFSVSFCIILALPLRCDGSQAARGVLSGLWIAGEAPRAFCGLELHSVNVGAAFQGIAAGVHLCDENSVIIHPVANYLRCNAHGFFLCAASQEGGKQLLAVW